MPTAMPTAGNALVRFAVHYWAPIELVALAAWLWAARGPEAASLRLQ